MSAAVGELLTGPMLRSALSFPDATCERLYAAAKRKPWSVDSDIDWEPEEVLLGVQVILETFAHAIFSEGSKLGKQAAATAIRMPGFEDAKYFLASLADYVGKDEARHVAFGVAYVRLCWADMSSARRDALQLKAEAWMQMLGDLIGATSGPMARLGVQENALRDRVVRACHAHFRLIGLEGY